MSNQTPYPRTPEEYQEEMMRLYRTSHAAPQSTPMQSVQAVPDPTPEPTPTPAEPEPMPAPTPQPTPIPQPEPSPMPEPTPPPEPMPMPEQPTVMPEMTTETTRTERYSGEAESTTETTVSKVEKNGIGWIQVITRSAGDALALPGVSVLITNNAGEKMHLERVSITNESGETEKIPLPVPDASLSLEQDQANQSYTTYDVSVYASGYYQQVSHDVPVFAGITSRQIFSMIPLPIYPQEPPATITYQNNEPRI